MPTKEDQARIDRMKAKIAGDPATAFKVLRVIWDRQQREEKLFHEWAGHDGGRGFQPGETTAMNELYERYASHEFRWQEMDSVDVIRAMKSMKKYAWQFLEAERERREAELEDSKRFWEEGLARAGAAQRARTEARWGPDALTGRPR